MVSFWLYSMTSNFMKQLIRPERDAKVIPLINYLVQVFHFFGIPINSSCNLTNHGSNCIWITSHIRTSEDHLIKRRTRICYVQSHSHCIHYIRSYICWTLLYSSRRILETILLPVPINIGQNFIIFRIDVTQALHRLTLTQCLNLECNLFIFCMFFNECLTQFIEYVFIIKCGSVNKLNDQESEQLATVSGLVSVMCGQTLICCEPHTLLYVVVKANWHRR